MIKTKKVTKSGSITLPKELRTETGIYPQTVVDIETKGTEITIKPHVPTCRFCGSAKWIVKVDSLCGLEICKSCIAKIVQAEDKF